MLRRFRCVQNFVSKPKLHTNSRWGKREARKNGSMMIGCKGSTRYSNYLEDYWPCAGGLSVGNAIGTQMRGAINSGLTQWRLTVYIDAVAESGRNPMNTHQIQFECEK